MDPRPLRRRLPALILGGALFLTPAVRALPLLSGPDGPAAVRESSGGLLAWLGQAFSRLWAEESTDAGPLIDPDGRLTGQGAGASAETDNGPLIDPNG
jgi:hypothetical protein